MSKLTAIASPPDLDSIGSVYLLRRALRGVELEVKYLEHNEIERKEADYILDSPHGKARIKRFDHHGEKVHSCSAIKVVESFSLGRAEKRLAEAICWQDNAGWKSLQREGMDNLLDLVLRSFIAAGKDINEIEDIFKVIFDSMIIKFEQDYSLIEEIRGKIMYRGQDKGKVLVVSGDYPKDLIFREFEPLLLVKAEGAYVSVTRSASLNVPDLNSFKPILERNVRDISRWFFHPIGFYFGYSPEPGKREERQIDPVVLGKLLEDFLKSLEI